MQRIEALGLQFTPLDTQIYPSVALAFDDTEFVVCSTPVGNPITLFTSPVLFDCARELVLYSTVNEATRDLGVGRFAVVAPRDQPERAHVTYQLGGFENHFVNDNDYLRFCLTFSAHQGVEGRTFLAGEGVTGREPRWTGDDVYDASLMI